MSLIHEALRKARRDQEEDDARGVVYARGLTGKRRRHGLGTGILFGALLAVAAGAAVGVGLWLWHGDRSGAAPATQAGSSATQAAVEPASGSAPSHPATTPTPGAVVAAPAAAVPATPAPATASSQPPGRLAGESEEPAVPAAGTPRSPPAERATPRETRGSDGERVFHVEADLGYAALAVDYIVARPSDPFARINGLDARVGDTIEGFTVDAITPTEVRLHDARGPLVLKVP